MHDWTSLCKKLTGLAAYRFSKVGLLEWRDSPDKEWREFTHLDKRMFVQILDVEWSIIQQSVVWLAEKKRQRTLR